MEQPTAKKERLILAAGLVLALAAAAFQYFSPVSRELMAGRDVALALLGERSSVLLVFHPFSNTVGAFTAQHPKAKKSAAPGERAAALAASAAGRGPGESVYHITFSSAPELDQLWSVLNGWRAEPRRLVGAAAWAASLRRDGATDLSSFDIFSLFAEACRLSSSNFVLTEVQRKAAPQEEAAEEEEQRRPLVEVFNASGRSGLASRTTRRLRDLGFDVITEASWPGGTQKHTRLLGFSKDTSAALKLRSALGLEELEIHVKPASKSVAAAAVVLGQDFRENGKRE